MKRNFIRRDGSDLHGRSATRFVLAGLLWLAADLGGLLGGLAEYTFVFIALATLVSSQIGIARFRPTPQWPWRFLTLSLVVFLVGGAVRQAVGSFGDLSPTRSLAPDYVVLPGYVVFAAALAGFLRSRSGARRHDIDAVLDSAVIAFAALTIAWVYLMNPALTQSDLSVRVRLSLAIYPPLSVFLAAMAVRISFTAGQRQSAAQRLFLGMVCAIVVGDVFSTLGDAHLVEMPKRIADLPYALAFLSLGAIYLHPSMKTLTERRSSDETQPMRGRLVLIAAALVVPALVSQFRGRSSREENLVLALIVFALTAAAVARVARALHQHAAAEAAMRYRATHDELTGLPNRSRLLSVVAQKLERTDRDGQVAVLFVDIDRFKLVNDSSGHSVGDELLIAIARRLDASASDGRFTARLGGDEFVVVIDGVGDISEVVQHAEAIRAELEVPFLVRNAEIFSSASIGLVVAERGEGGRTAESLVRDADTAMYQVKSSGGGGVAVFDSAMRDERTQRLLLEQDLHKAVDRDEFRVYYQPIVGLQTGVVEGFEALIRWVHPTRGLIPPVSFIPIAEETGLISRIGEWVLQQAAAQLAEWQRTLPSPHGLYMAVNLSARQLRDPNLVSRIAAAIADNALAPKSLCLELTESVLTDEPDIAARLLAEIRSLGVRLSLDDFGTGYSSLAYLNRFAVDQVKIDKSFVDHLAEDGCREEPLVAAIIAMAGALSLSTVAEGVETVEQALKVKQLGATRAQGYLFSRPLPSDAVAPIVDRLHAAALSAIAPSTIEQPALNAAPA